DTHLAELYRADRQSGTVIGIIAVLALVIACLGLFGLASITTVQRTKEIGIRKVLGASPRELVLMLSRGFAGMVGVAFLIAAPLTYLLMQRWLENFAYRIEINAWVFVLAGALSLAIALLTISFHALRAARTNPVSALRSE
ncbi:MAG: FtsX-like permease family protein, partial [Calditrichaeota bacterium]|nr:FtsX-like permease family protein [Calditrichota bacterium]